jgi:ketosteroid isomerase-like protein
MSAVGKPDPDLVQLALDAWEAVARSDREGLGRLCAPGLVWHASGRGKWAGTQRGLDAVFEYLAALGEAADEFASEVQDVLVSDRRAAVLFHVSGRRQGKTLDTDFVLIFEIEDGRIRRISSVPRDQLSVDEFWA